MQPLRQTHTHMNTHTLSARQVALASLKLLRISLLPTILATLYILLVAYPLHDCRQDPCRTRLSIPDSRLLNAYDRLRRFLVVFWIHAAIWCNLRLSLGPRVGRTVWPVSLCLGLSNWALLAALYAAGAVHDAVAIVPYIHVGLIYAYAHRLSKSDKGHTTRQIDSEGGSAAVTVVAEPQISRDPTDPYPDDGTASSLCKAILFVLVVYGFLQFVFIPVFRGLGFWGKLASRIVLFNLLCTATQSVQIWLVRGLDARGNPRRTIQSAMVCNTLVLFGRLLSLTSDTIARDFLFITLSTIGDTVLRLTYSHRLQLAQSIRSALTAEWGLGSSINALRDSVVQTESASSNTLANDLLPNETRTTGPNSENEARSPAPRTASFVLTEQVVVMREYYLFDSSIAEYISVVVTPIFQYMFRPLNDSISLTLSQSLLRTVVVIPFQLVLVLLGDGLAIYVESRYYGISLLRARRHRSYIHFFFYALCTVLSLHIIMSITWVR